MDSGADRLTEQAATGGILMLDTRLERPARHAAGLLDRLTEVWSILSQAVAAAHLYEELSRKCDSALAEQGIERFDVPRAAYRELTKGLDPLRAGSRHAPVPFSVLVGTLPDKCAKRSSLRRFIAGGAPPSTAPSSDR
jgi:hypothetical protein